MQYILKYILNILYICISDLQYIWQPHEVGKYTIDLRLGIKLSRKKNGLAVK